MHIGAIVAGIVAFLLMVGGVFTTPVPILGSVLSFSAPVLSLVGIVLAGIAMSRAKQAGQPNGAAIAGLVVNIITFILSLLVAITCGLCNALVTTPHGDEFSAQWSQAMDGLEARVSLLQAVEQIQSVCASDPSGAAAAPLFHGRAFEPLQPTLCASLTPQLVQAFARDCTSGEHPCSRVSPPDGRDQTALGAMGVADPSRCHRFTSGTATILACNLPTGFKIVDAVDLAGVR